MQNWILENTEENAKEHPGQFFIPSTVERKTLDVGDLVRLHFLLTNKGPVLPRAERMWVEITNVNGTGDRFSGRLLNQPQYIQGLKKGDLIQFQKQHIAQIFIKETDPQWVECGEQSALLSKRCFNDGETVRFLYREEGDRPIDSGWHLFTGHESDAENNDPKNIRVCNIYWLLDWDPTLFPVIKTGKPGEAFERLDKNQDWAIVDDWIPEE